MPSALDDAKTTPDDDALAGVLADAAELIREIERARIFVEGRPARVVVTRAADVAGVRELVAIQVRA